MKNKQVIRWKIIPYYLEIMQHFLIGIDFGNIWF